MLLKAMRSIGTAFGNIPEIGRNIENLSIHRLYKTVLKLRGNILP
jgi:hypothetical protein